jgi:uncharacterized Rmd1/YagE family protein
MKEEDEFEMAKRENAAKKRLCGTIDAKVFDRFEAYCDSNGYDRSKLLELVIKKFMDVKDGKSE